MALICPLAKCKEKKGPCGCEKVAAVVAGLGVFLFLYVRILMQP